jgi:hypothetical protein
MAEDQGLRPDQLLSAKHDHPDQTGELIDAEPGVPCDRTIPLPSVAAVRAYLTLAGWTEGPPGRAGSLWRPPGESSAGIGVPFDDGDPDLLRGAIERIARKEGRTAAQLARILAARGADSQGWNAAAATIPGEWVDAAEAHYSMHGAGLIRNILAGVEPLIRADERERNAKLASEHKAICVCYCGRTEYGDGRPGHPRKFADFIRGEAET